MRSSAAHSWLRTTACRAVITITRRATAARSAGFTATAAPGTRWRAPACRTSPRGWISRRWPTRPWPRDSTVAGFTTQAHALAALGIDRELAELQRDADERTRYQLAQSVQTLMLPGEMGERFKLMALTRGNCGPLTAFSLRDFSSSL